MAPTAIPFELEKLATAVAVGSIFALGLALLADALEPELLQQLGTVRVGDGFGVLAAIPIIAFLYVVGSVLMIVSDLVFQYCAPKFYEDEWALIVALAGQQNDYRTAVFTRIYQKKKLLEAIAAPLVVLGAGLMAELRNVPSLKTTLLVSGGAMIAIGLIMPLATGRLHKDMARIVSSGRPALETNTKEGGS